jgi:4-amino-4-deoxy-L-arabinose transferase-like glycosyltransferase
MMSAPKIDLTEGHAEIVWSKNLFLIVIVAFTLRAVVRWHSGEADFWTNGYTFFFELAQNIASGRGIAFDGGPPTAFRVPLYPILLAAVTFGHREFLRVILFQSLIGAGTVWCAALIARDMFGKAAAIIAALLTAIYPYYVVHDTALQETSLYTFLTALAVFLLMQARRNGSVFMALSAGFTLGAAVLTRANLAPFAVFAPLWLIVPPASNAVLWQRRFGTCLLCAGTMTLTVSPWLARSYWLTGSPMLSTESGFSLWEANNPYTFSHYPTESIDRSADVAFEAFSPQERTEIETLGPNEAAVDEWFRRKALDYMQEHPFRTLVNGVRKIGAAFCFLPSPRRSFWPNLVYLLSYAPVMVLGIWGMWVGRGNWREHLIFYALFVTFAGVTAVFYGHTNYRTYLDLYWIVFAASLLNSRGNKNFHPQQVNSR